MHVRCTAHPQATMIKTGCNRAKPLIMALLCIIAMACVRDSDSGGMVRTNLPLNRLHDGDLLFRCGVGAASQAVIEMDKNKGMYTHIGIAINDGGMWKVVHAVPGESADGVDLVKIEPIDTFFLTTRAVRGAAMRLEQCDSLTAHAAAMWARGCATRGVPFDDQNEVVKTPYEYLNDTWKDVTWKITDIGYYVREGNTLDKLGRRTLVIRLRDRFWHELLLVYDDLDIDHAMKIVRKSKKELKEYRIDL